MANEKIIRWSIIIIFILLACFMVIVVGDKKRVNNNYTTTLRNLQDENQRLEKLVTDSARTIRNVSGAITIATESIGTIDSGIGDSINAIGASIRIAEELFGLVDYIARAIAEYETNLSP